MTGNAALGGFHSARVSLEGLSGRLHGPQLFDQFGQQRLAGRLHVVAKANAARHFASIDRRALKQKRLNPLAPDGLGNADRAASLMRNAH